MAPDEAFVRSERPTFKPANLYARQATAPAKRAIPAPELSKSRKRPSQGAANPEITKPRSKGPSASDRQPRQVSRHGSGKANKTQAANAGKTESMKCRPASGLSAEATARPQRIPPRKDRIMAA